MPDSAPSVIFTATSPAQAAPMPPLINFVTFIKLEARVVIAMPTKDVNEDDLGNLVNIKVFFGPTGLFGELVEFPGNYPPGSQQTVVVPVPNYSVSYDFEVEVGI